ncbi:MAG: hypothetical protein H6Q29_1050, partial [Bacteroidetes bacterium]|nr:hypothetical protein [Bacteroidota bacterium]
AVGEPATPLRVRCRASPVRRLGKPEGLALRQPPECDILHPETRVQALAPRVNPP